MVNVVVKWNPEIVALCNKIWQMDYFGLSFLASGGMIFDFGNMIRFAVDCWMFEDDEIKIWIEKKENGNWIPYPTYNPFYHQFGTPNEDYGMRHEIFSFEIPLDTRFLKFRIRIAGTYGHDGGTRTWSDQRNPSPWWGDGILELVAYVDYFGDFSLDYLPMTILYCPPEQDMLNSLEQSNLYGTTVSMGFLEEVGTETSLDMKVKGGVKIGLNSDGYGAGSNIGSGTANSMSSSIAEGEGYDNYVNLSYEWQSKLNANNISVVGRRYWGPLGDIFLLLKNPWFSILQNLDAEITVANCDKTRLSTEIVIAPGHKLLRPGNDPVVSNIAPSVRRRILELDPFYTNLDPFFTGYEECNPVCYLKPKDAADTINYQGVYRFKNVAASKHYYITNQADYNNLSEVIYEKQGLAFYIGVDNRDGKIPLFQLTMSSNTYFTISEQDKTDKINEGYTDAGIFGYVYSLNSANVPMDHSLLYCCFNEFIVDHFYTGDKEELFVQINGPRDLNEAINSLINPSVGNRACLIAKYSILSGVELDLSKVEAITIGDTVTNTREMYSEVSETNITDTGFFLDTPFIGFNSSTESSLETGKFVSLLYQSSVETKTSVIRTAACKLLRNQNQENLYPIEVWYDKYYSTFMFRKIEPLTFTFVGVLLGVLFRLQNTLVELIPVDILIERYPDLFKKLIELFPPLDPWIQKDIDLSIEDINIIDQIRYFIDIIDRRDPNLIHRTMSDNLGEYSLDNVTKGTYLMFAGNVFSTLTLPDPSTVNNITIFKNLQNVKRIFDLNTFNNWELNEILEIDTVRHNLEKGAKMQKEIRNLSEFSRSKLGNILNKFGYSIKTVEDGALVRYSSERLILGTAAINGWISNINNNGLSHIPVYLIQKKLIKEIPETELMDIHKILEQIPENLFRQTISNKNGKYKFRNVRLGEYVIIVGNQFKYLGVSIKDLEIGLSKTLNFNEVKRTFNIKTLSISDLRHSFKIPRYLAVKIESRLKKMKKISESEVFSLLEENKIKLNKEEIEILY